MTDYEQCAFCDHSTEYGIEDDELMELLCHYPISIAIENGEEQWQDCSECIKQGSHCTEHGRCTRDPDICECCGNDVHD